jgi:histone H1/5
MVQEAIMAVKEPGGSSMNDIEKYDAGKHNVDSDKLSPAIAKYLKTAVTSGEMVQSTGKGATCFFKLAAAPARGCRIACSGPTYQ